MSEAKDELRRIHEDAAQIIRMMAEVSAGHSSKPQAVLMVAERIQLRALRALSQAQPNPDEPDSRAMVSEGK